MQHTGLSKQNHLSSLAGLNKNHSIRFNFLFHWLCHLDLSPESHVVPLHITVPSKTVLTTLSFCHHRIVQLLGSLLLGTAWSLHVLVSISGRQLDLWLKGFTKKTFKSCMAVIEPGDIIVTHSLLFFLLTKMSITELDGPSTCPSPWPDIRVQGWSSGL